MVTVFPATPDPTSTQIIAVDELESLSNRTGGRMDW